MSTTYHKLAASLIADASDLRHGRVHRGADGAATFERDQVPRIDALAQRLDVVLGHLGAGTPPPVVTRVADDESPTEPVRMRASRAAARRALWAHEDDRVEVLARELAALTAMGRDVGSAS